MHPKEVADDLVPLPQSRCLAGFVGFVGVRSKASGGVPGVGILDTLLARVWTVG